MHSYVLIIFKEIGSFTSKYILRLKDSDRIWKFVFDTIIGGIIFFLFLSLIACY
jgi:hypothetical protein